MLRQRRALSGTQGASAFSWAKASTQVTQGAGADMTKADRVSSRAAETLLMGKWV